MKAYWIVRSIVTDPVQYAEYIKRTPAVIHSFGGRWLVRGGNHVTKEGEDRPRNIIVEFPDYETALACYDSPEYQAVLKLQEGAADRHLCIVEGIGDVLP